MKLITAIRPSKAAMLAMRRPHSVYFVYAIE